MKEAMSSSISESGCDALRAASAGSEPSARVNLLDLFSGIGGFSLGLEAAGFRTVAFCEVSPKCRHLLNHHWPAVPCYDDICTLTGERLVADGLAVDALCGGFPCQDLSYAGKGAGLAGERSGLWFQIARLLRELRDLGRPVRIVVLENVSALLGRGLGVVLGDLAALGYDAEWDCIRARDVGAPHLRDRIWIVAYARGIEHEGFGDAFRRALAEGLHEAFARHTGLPAWDDAEADALDPDANGLGSHRAEVHELGSPELRDEQVREPGPLGEDVADPHGGRVRGGGRRSSPRAPSAAGREVRQQRLRADAEPGGQNLPDPDSQRPKGRRLPALPREALPDTLRCGASGGWPRSRSGGWWSTEPDVGRVAHGVPARVDRLHGLGNAVVPQIPEVLGRAILAARAALQAAA